MRVLINAASAHMGGAVTYLRNVLRWLPTAAPDVEAVVYVPPVTRERLSDLESPSVDLRSYPFGATSGSRRLFFDQVLLPRDARRERADVLFSATGFGTFKVSIPQVLLVRNMAYFDPAFEARYRATGRSLRRTRLRRWHSFASIRAADVILFPSEAMRAAVAGRGSLGTARTEIVPYGFDRERFLAGEGGEPGIVERIRRWRADDCTVLLNVSTFAVQKNLETLVRALPLIAARGVRARLVTTTSRDRTTDTAEYDAVKRWAAEAGLASAWIEAGYVPYEALHHLYEAADLYVFPSFTESFGHSLVEAMASGLPVVAADTPVNREVCGEAGTYFDTFDPDECARSVVEVLGTDRSERIVNGRRRAERYSWERHAHRLGQIFREAAMPVGHAMRHRTGAGA